MKRIKKTRNHNIWEIWNEDTAESVYFIGKPTSLQVKDVVDTNWWNKRICSDSNTLDQYIEKRIFVNKLPHVFCKK